MIPKKYPQILPKAILFDWDNTLVDTWSVAHESLNIALASIGKPTWSVEKFFEQPHHSFRNAASAIFGERWQEAEQVFYDTVAKRHLKELKILEGATELIKSLKELGIYMSIVSNKSGHLLRKEAEHLNWTIYFQKIIGARDTEEDKPSPIPVHTALSETDVKPGHDVWFVGDSIVDVHCAHASGCIPVVVGHGEASRQKDIIHAIDCNGLAKLVANL